VGLGRPLGDAFPFAPRLSRALIGIVLATLATGCASSSRLGRAQAPRADRSARPVTPPVPSTVETDFGSAGSSSGPARRRADPTRPAFDWPVQKPVILQFYGWRTTKRMHDGIDLRAPTGTAILSSADGTVIYRGSRLRGYGRLIVIDHGGGWSTAYAHLSKYVVGVGRKVRKGQLIGYSGRSGRAQGPHLHFELRKGADPIDPLSILWPGYEQALVEGDLD